MAFLRRKYSKDPFQIDPHLRMGGIGPKRKLKIVSAWSDQLAVRQIMLFLHSHGLSTSRAVRIHKTYGAEAIEKIRSNPYLLAKDIRGIGFKTADAVAQKLGIPRDSRYRACAGLEHILLEATQEGIRLGEALRSHRR